MSFGFAWLGWRRLTYLTSAEDIRVEHGLLSRSARSVPYERIQDVSIEQKWLPRLLGLAEVKFETGAGGKEEISLAYLSLEGLDASTERPSDSLCHACLTREYPTRIPSDTTKLRFERV